MMSWFSRTSTTGFDPGPVVNLAVGHALPLGFRVEAELGYAHYAVAGVSPLSSDGAFPELTGKRLALQSGGGRASYSATINAFYDLPVAGPVVPFVGLRPYILLICNYCVIDYMN